MEGNTRDNISFMGNVKKSGFETVIPLKTNGAFVVANALAADGTVMATTDVWDMELGATVSYSTLSSEIIILSPASFFITISSWGNHC